jgi:hypothetical protein
MQGVEMPSWPALVVFVAAVLVIAMFVIAAAGHFPREHRKPALASPSGSVVLWITIALVALAAIAAISFAWMALPWYAAIIGAGLMILIAPYLLHPLPDSFVNGRSSLLICAVLAVVLVGAMHWLL